MVEWALGAAPATILAAAEVSEGVLEIRLEE
jgi:hypothetical protein